MEIHYRPMANGRWRRHVCVMLDFIHSARHLWCFHSARAGNERLGGQGGVGTKQAGENGPKNVATMESVLQVSQFGWLPVLALDESTQSFVLATVLVLALLVFLARRQSKRHLIDLMGAGNAGWCVHNGARASLIARNRRVMLWMAICHEPKRQPVAGSGRG